MCFTIDQIDQACGLLLLNEFNTFIYHCKKCANEFDSGTDLESHILSEHLDDKEHIENVFDEIFVDDFDRKSDDCCVEREMENYLATGTVLIKHEPKSESIELESESETTPDTDDTYDPPEDIKKEKKPSRVGKKRSKVAKNPNVRMYYCDMCPDNSFTLKSNLKNHMKLHIEKRLRKKCPICNKLPMNFEKHMRLNHTVARPYKCDYCEKTFRSNINRESHQRSHTGETPYLCSNCGKAFRSLASLYRHQIRMHSIQLPHPCTQCDRRFINPSSLKEHFYAFHSDDRPYKCEVCGNSYSTKKYLRTHKLFHGDKKFQCGHCNTFFYTSGTRRFHEKTIHNIV